MNLTTIFFPPTLNVKLDSYTKTITELDEGLSDVLTGVLFLIPFFVSSSFETTIPYTQLKGNMLLPCPKAILGTEKVLTTFSLSVWLTIGLVLLLTTAVFWCAGNGPYRSVCNETHTYRSLSNCFHNAWAVFMAVSVPQQPRTSTLRVFFFLYVCFCFAISSVFQAFFVSYLVEPKYEKELETLDELLDSNVVYGDNPALNVALGTVSYPELMTFLDHKRLQEDCSDIRKCVERMVTKRDIAVFIDPVLATYFAREMGTVDVGKVLCSLDETLMSVGLTVLLRREIHFWTDSTP
jgi:hypothetical protein